MKYIIVGKCTGNEGGGPANIIKGLLKEYSKKGIKAEGILWDGKSSKLRYIWILVKKILLDKNVIVNVHTSGFLIPLIILIFSKINNKNNYYLTIHGIYTFESKQNGKKFYKILEKHIYIKFPNIVCVSDMLKKDIENIFGRSERVYVIYNATDAKSNLICHMDNTKVKFVMIGGLRERKGIKETIELVSYLVNEKNLNIFLNIYGVEDGIINIQWLNEMLIKLNIEKRVIYKGNVSDKQFLYDEIAQADFQICLSHYDTFNVAVAESLVLGCPCIVSDRCGAAYLIENNKNGIIVSLDDNSMKEKVYKYICLFLDNPAKRQEIYSSRKKYVELLSWEKVCTLYIQLMQGSYEEEFR